MFKISLRTDDVVMIDHIRTSKKRKMSSNVSWNIFNEWKSRFDLMFRFWLGVWLISQLVRVPHCGSPPPTVRPVCCITTLLPQNWSCCLQFATHKRCCTVRAPLSSRGITSSCVPTKQQRRCRHARLSSFRGRMGEPRCTEAKRTTLCQVILWRKWEFVAAWASLSFTEVRRTTTSASRIWEKTECFSYTQNQNIIKGPYVVVVVERSLVGTIEGCPIYRIVKVSLVPVLNPVPALPEKQAPCSLPRSPSLFSSSLPPTLKAEPLWSMMVLFLGDMFSAVFSIYVVLLLYRHRRRVSTHTARFSSSCCRKAISIFHMTMTLPIRLYVSSAEFWSITSREHTHTERAESREQRAERCEWTNGVYNLLWEVGVTMKAAKEDSASGWRFGRSTMAQGWYAVLLEPFYSKRLYREPGKASCLNRRTGYYIHMLILYVSHIWISFLIVGWVDFASDTRQHSSLPFHSQGQKLWFHPYFSPFSLPRWSGITENALLFLCNSHVWMSLL